MKKKAILLGLMLLCGTNVWSYSVYHLTCEHATNPLGVETSTPRFSWKLHAQERGTMQSAYQIIVADTEENLSEENCNIWNSGKVYSDNSVLVPFSGKTLTPATTYYWKVRSWDNRGDSSSWSKTARFTTGLPTEADWGKARWIALERDSRKTIPFIHAPLVKKTVKAEETVSYKLPQFRKEIAIKKEIKQALIFICGLGHFDLFLNGKKVGNHFLDPGWTLYNKEALYVAFDVTDNLHAGKNVMGVMLGNGFYHIPRERYFKLLGSFGAPKMRLKLLIRYSDGSHEEIVSDKSWRTTESAITYSSIYGGEDYDATREEKGWNDKCEFDTRNWEKAIEVKQDIILRAQVNNAMTERQRVPTVTRYKNEKGQWIYDLGQNFSGIIHVVLKSGKSQPVIFRPAELLNKDRSVNQSATGRPYYFKYTTRGDNTTEEWQPRFSYYGFRYVQIEGAVPAQEENPDGLPEIVSLEGIHLCNSAAETGTFSCSKPLFNQIYNLIDWAMRSNMASVLTDCPHREKLGWLEQNHLMQYALQYRYDMATAYSKIMNDMEASQLENGCIPTIAPEYVRFDSGFEDTPEWGSAFIICPWYIYQWYGDRRLIEEHYPAMQKFLDYLTSRSNNHIVAYGLGDWFDIGPKKPGRAQLTSNGLTATTIYYYDATLMARMAGILGKADDQKRYSNLAAEIKEAYNQTFFHLTDTTYDKNSQTANAMSLYMGLVEPPYREKIIRNLLSDIEDRNYALTAGDIGYRYVLRTLEECGLEETIYRMNCQYDVPGYGWQLAHGATSLTESWQAYGFVSNNHMMLGHFMEWLFSGLGGIRQDDHSTAFRHIVIDPQAVGDITYASTEYESTYGRIACQWKKQAGKYTLRVEVPANCRAIVTLPSDNPEHISEYGVPLSCRKEILPVDKGHKESRWAIGSGSYLFEVATE